ncbi:MAG TPA: hypothetical protein VFV98_11225 [Vicinamibacterales bacterium]|nr:hypothetical protein [Vicinamibacterales bacterium]
MGHSRLHTFVAAICAAAITAVAGGSVWCQPLCAPPDTRAASCHAASTATPALAELHDCSTHSLAAFTIEVTRAHQQATSVAVPAASAALLSMPLPGHVFALEHIASPPTSSPPRAIRVLRI